MNIDLLLFIIWNINLVILQPIIYAPLFLFSEFPFSETSEDSGHEPLAVPPLTAAAAAGPCKLYIETSKHEAVGDIYGQISMLFSLGHCKLCFGLVNVFQILYFYFDLLMNCIFPFMLQWIGLQTCFIPLFTNWRFFVKSKVI